MGMFIAKISRGRTVGEIINASLTGDTPVGVCEDADRYTPIFVERTHICTH